MPSNRRAFLKNSSLALGGLFVFNNLQGYAAEPLVQTTSKVRKNISKLKNDDPDLQSYRKAVQVMKSRPASNPRSWEAQAAIHNSFCPHSNWFFLPWHCAYLLYFEEVCREASGNDNFCLPYWDWTEFPQIPAAFWGDASNPLFEPSRRATATSVASSEFIGSEVITRILQSSAFEEMASTRSTTQRARTGTGILEGTPHNYIHNFVGGKMSIPRTAALDPLFWLHHANVDRIWATWNDQGRKNSTEPAYTDFVFPKNFVNRAGTAVDVTVKSMLNNRAAGYVYDTQTATALIAALGSSNFLINASLRSSVMNKEVVQKAEAASFELEAKPVVTTSIKKLLEANTTTQNKKIIKAIISDIEPPSQENFFVRVFINCDYLNKLTPINDPHYVGSFTFFASDHAHDTTSGHAGHGGGNGEKLKFTFDITDTLEKVADVSSIDNIADKIAVQLLPIPFDDKDPAQLLPGKIEVVVAEVVG